MGGESSTQSYPQVENCLQSSFMLSMSAVEADYCERFPMILLLEMEEH
jgi:hypothetical protein